MNCKYYYCENCGRIITEAELNYSLIKLCPCFTYYKYMQTKKEFMPADNILKEIIKNVITGNENLGLFLEKILTIFKREAINKNGLECWLFLLFEKWIKRIPGNTEAQAERIADRIFNFLYEKQFYKNSLTIFKQEQ